MTESEKDNSEECKWGGNQEQERDLLSPSPCITLTYLRRNDVDYLRIPTPSFEELGPKLEGTTVTNSVHTPCLTAKEINRNKTLKE